MLIKLLLNSSIRLPASESHYSDLHSKRTPGILGRHAFKIKITLRIKICHAFSESSAIHVARYLLEEHAELCIYDPKVTKQTMINDLTNWVDKKQGGFFHGATK